ncbi:MAG: hypothetical protein ACREHD_12420 [Pirellulales bacterium]
MAENPYRGFGTLGGDRNDEEPPQRKPVVWYIVGTIATVTGLFAACGIFLWPVPIFAQRSFAEQCSLVGRLRRFI